MLGRSFAEVLDDALGATVPPRVASSRVETFTLPPRDPFLFFSLRDSARARVPFVRGGLPIRPPDPVEPRRPSRTLTQGQRWALEALNALGARLSPDFTADQLRHEYRRLAHRLHPDRHHDRSDAERRRLAHQFGEATDHYRQLRAIVEERH